MTTGDERFNVRGKVVELDSNRALPRLRVEVYDRDRQANPDPLGEDTTKGDGSFEITIERARYRTAPGATPQFHVQVFRGDAVVYSAFPAGTWVEPGRVFETLIEIPRGMPRATPARPPVAAPGAPAGAPPARTGADGFDNGRRADIVDALEDIASYMPTSHQAGGAPTGPRSAGGAPPGTLQEIVDRELVAVLGGRWKLTEDAKPEGKSVLASLARAFPAEQTDEGPTYRFSPRAYAVTTELGGTITGAQASLYRRAKAALDDALPLLDRLEPQEAEADEEDIAAVRLIVRKEFIELVNELGREGGPRVQRVDEIFDLLLDQLDELRDVFRFPPDEEEDLSGRSSEPLASAGDITTVEEEQNFTDFLVIRDYVTGLEATWEANKSAFRPGGKAPFLGTQLLLLGRVLSTAAEQVEDAYRAMDAVGLGPAERQTVVIPFCEDSEDNGKGQLTVDELLDWVTRFTTDEGPTLIREGGRHGVRAIRPTAERLQDLVEAAAEADVAHVGFSRVRVRRTLRELAAQLAQVAELARELAPDEESVELTVARRDGGGEPAGRRRRIGGRRRRR